ncbi:MAG: hypothetical protein LUQ28_07825 [Methylococcaceae bacterium]|nr:hypothetical protein [Methylococcaceae bacterium]
MWWIPKVAGVSVVDTEKNTVSSSIATGAGHHEFAFSDDSRTAYISNTNAPSIAIIDIEHLSIKNTINSPTPLVALAFSALSKSAYVATENGSLLVIDANGQLLAPIDTGFALKTVRFSGNGRWGFAVSQTANKVFIIDASLNRLTQTLAVGSAPDQISFTDNFAYIRSTGNEIVSMLELTALDKNAAVSVTSFSGGQAAPSQSDLLLTDAIVPTPEHNAVVVANPSDKTIYYYTEGMAAPMGNFENLGLKPLAVMIVNRSMQETAAGIYTGITHLPPTGSYIVSILLDNNPPLYHCFSTNIVSKPKQEKQRTQAVTVDYLLDKKEVPVGVLMPIKLKLNHAVQDNVTDLQLLIFRIPGQWQQRLLAKPLGNSLYQVDITPPEAGVYQVFAQSPSLNFTFNEQPILTFRAVKP